MVQDGMTFAYLSPPLLTHKQGDTSAIIQWCSHEGLECVEDLLKGPQLRDPVSITYNYLFRRAEAFCLVDMGTGVPGETSRPWCERHGCHSL